MTDFIVVLICIVLAWFGGMIIGYDLATENRRNVVEECQKTLPRNVECVIVAVPETEIGEVK